MELVSNAVDQCLLGELALSGATLTKRIDESQHLEESRISQGCGGSRFVQRLETDAALLTFGEWPHWGQLGAWLNLFVERRRSIRRRHPAGDFASFGWKGVFHSVHEKLLHGLEQRTVATRIARHQPRQNQPLEGRVDLGGADRKIDAHLSHGRTGSPVAQEFQENQDILRPQNGLGHSIFAIREYRIPRWAPFSTPAEGDERRTIEEGTKSQRGTNETDNCELIDANLPPLQLPDQRFS